jgi:hypothetical protein
MSDLTHIVPGHAVQRGRGPNHRPQFLALCGTPCEDLHMVAHDPTCPDCARIDADDEQQLLALRQLPPVEPPKKFQAFNDQNLAWERERVRR